MLTDIYLNYKFVPFREKAELWKKADDMEHEIKVKADDRWMDDSEVSNCLGCKAEFSFLLRKVCFVTILVTVTLWFIVRLSPSLERWVLSLCYVPVQDNKLSQYLATQMYI